MQSRKVGLIVSYLSHHGSGPVLKLQSSLRTGSRAKTPDSSKSCYCYVKAEHSNSTSDPRRPTPTETPSADQRRLVPRLNQSLGVTEDRSCHTAEVKLQTWNAKSPAKTLRHNETRGDRAELDRYEANSPLTKPLPNAPLG